MSDFATNFVIDSSLGETRFFVTIVRRRSVTLYLVHNAVQRLPARPSGSKRTGYLSSDAGSATSKEK